MSDPKILSSFIASDRSKEFMDILVIHFSATKEQKEFHKTHSYIEGEDYM
jgi:hypothetical protein